MGKVLIDVAGVDDEEILPVFKAVEICVVDRSARFVRDDAVLRLTHVQREHVARQDMLQKRDLMRPMWDTSKIAQCLRQYRCSVMIPSGYWIGISQPPKSTIVAFASRCA